MIMRLILQSHEILFDIALQIWYTIYNTFKLNKGTALVFISHGIIPCGKAEVNENKRIGRKLS